MPLTRTEIKNLEALVTKKGRRQQQRFIAEGTRLLEESLRHKVSPEVVYYSPAMLSERAERLIEQFIIARVRCEQIPARLVGKLAETRKPQGIIGVFPLPGNDLRQLYRPRHRTLVVCDGVSDPGNLGTLLRSALSFEFNLAVLTGATAEPFSPKVVRASMGAVFGLTVAVSEAAEIQQLLAEDKFVGLAATVVPPAVDNWRRQIGRTRRVALAIGSEACGLSPEIEKLAPVKIHIEHSPLVESLNAAVAGSILMRQVYDFRK